MSWSEDGDCFREPDYFVRQCELVAVVPGGTAHKTCWLPEQFAAAGKTVRLLRADGTKGPWFTVVRVGDVRRSCDDAAADDRLRRRYRESKRG